MAHVNVIHRSILAHVNVIHRSILAHVNVMPTMSEHSCCLTTNLPIYIYGHGVLNYLLTHLLT